MTPREYFEQIALPTYVEYQNDKLSVRRAILACQTIAHVVDCIREHSGQKDIDIIRAITQQCHFFRYIRAAALVSKHIKLERQEPRGLHISAIQKVRGAAFSDGSYYSDGTTHSDAPDVIGVKLDTREKWDLDLALKNVVEYLDKLTTELG